MERSVLLWLSKKCSLIYSKTDFGFHLMLLILLHFLVLFFFLNVFNSYIFILLRSKKKFPCSRHSPIECFSKMNLAANSAPICSFVLMKMLVKCWMHQHWKYSTSLTIAGDVGHIWSTQFMEMVEGNLWPILILGV